MTLLPIVPTLATAVAVAFLVHAEHGADAGRDVRRRRRVAKVVASAGFVAVALIGGAGWSYGRWIACGLALGALGDAALLGRKRRAFVAGMILFALDHLCVMQGAALVVAPADWPLAWGAAPLAIAAAVVASLWRQLGLLRVPVAIYAALIAAMLTAAAAPLLAGAPPWFGDGRAALLAAGALCFFASDGAVARQRFAHESFWNKAWGLPLYYAGQLLIAWSAAA
jgi:uncharacterized membrane protein YhhN